MAMLPLVVYDVELKASFSANAVPVFLSLVVDFGRRIARYWR
jgi:hypothetical protein